LVIAYRNEERPIPRETQATRDVAADLLGGEAEYFGRIAARAIVIPNSTQHAAPVRIVCVIVRVDLTAIRTHSKADQPELGEALVIFRIVRINGKEGLPAQTSVFYYADASALFGHEHSAILQERDCSGLLQPANVRLDAISGGQR
jgi:hypothetical protein